MTTSPPPLPEGARPEVLDFLLSRRSRPLKLLRGPGPDEATLTLLLTAAARCPDHGKLEPWRFIVLEKAALNRLAQAARIAGASAGP
jgi:nitroreductase